MAHKQVRNKAIGQTTTPTPEISDQTPNADDFDVAEIEKAKLKEKTLSKKGVSMVKQMMERKYQTNFRKRIVMQQFNQNLELQHQFNWDDISMSTMVKISLTHAFFLKTLQKEQDPTIVINMGPKKIDMENDVKNLTTAKCKEMFFEIIRKLIQRQI